MRVQKEGGTEGGTLEALGWNTEGVVLFDIVLYSFNGMFWYEEGGDTLSLHRDQLYGPSLLHCGYH